MTTGTNQELMLHNSSNEMVNARNYWTATFADAWTAASFPVLYSPAASGAAATGRHELPDELAAYLLKGTGGNASRLFTVLTAAVAAALRKYGSGRELVIGVPGAGEEARFPLPLRLEVEDGMLFPALLAAAGKALNEAGANGRYTIVQLAEHLELPPERPGYGLFETALLLEGLHRPQGLEAARPRFLFRFREAAGRLSFTVDYDAQWFTRELVDSISSHFITLLGNLLRAPQAALAEATLLSPDRRTALTAPVPACPEGPAPASVLCMLLEQTACAPEGPAIIAGGETLTYGELNRRAEWLAERLQGRGVGAEAVVGVLAERSPDTVCAMLAVWKAGGAYLPLDPALPPERISFMLKDSGAVLLLAGPRRVAQAEALGRPVLALPEEWGDAATEAPYALQASRPLPGPNELAYIIYTSGTTGLPKGVMIEHGQIANSIAWRSREYALGPDDRTLQLFSPVFDGFMTSFLTPLVSGAAVIMPDDRDAVDIYKLRELIASAGLTHFIAVPALYAALLELLSPGDGQTLRIITLAGDKLTATIVEESRRKLPALEIVNEYGPTECAVVAAFKRRATTERAELIGRPIANTAVYIVDERLAPVPVGCPGELLIAGAGVARGYLNRPELNSEKFIVHPFHPEEGRVYRTGDLARLLPGGDIEYIGRLDHQVKINGYRIETGEIEAVLRSHGQIIEAVAVAVGDGDRKLLCAYYTVRGAVSPRALRELLQSRLPAYMIPARLIPLKQFPLSANGKIDRAALPSAEAARDGQEGYAAPQTPTQRRLHELWTELLGTADIGIRDNFFEYGGQSLKGAVLMARIAKSFGKELPLGELFRHPTIEDLAACIDQAEAAGYSEIAPAKKAAVYPLSPQQMRMYLLNRLDEAGTAYNVPMALRIAGPLDIRRMEEALRRLALRHEAFRTSFVEVDGTPCQHIAETADFTLEQAAAVDKTPQEWLAEFVRPFDFARAPLLRVKLVESGPEEHLLLFDSHHIVADGLSMLIFFRQLLALYRGEELPSHAIDYKDYAVWLNRRRETGELAAAGQYWQQKFQGEIPLLNLPADFDRPPVQTFKGDSLPFAFDRRLSGEIYRLAAQSGATPYMVLLAVYSALLAKYAGQEELIIGLSTAGRDHADVQDMIGMFAGTLPIRCHPAKDKSFLAYLEEIKGGTLADMAHGDYPFEDLVGALKLKKDNSRNPLFDTMFTLHNLDMDSRAAGQAVFTPLQLKDGMSKFDLSLDAEDNGEGLSFILRYNVRLFKPETMERLAGHFRHLAMEIAANPTLSLGRYPILPPAEREAVLAGFNANAADYSGRMQPLHRLVERQAALRPGETAVAIGSRRLTYAELNAKSNRLALLLREAGIGKGAYVPVLMNRSLEMVIALYGVMKTGAAFCPLDVAWPAGRIGAIAADLGAELLLVNRDTPNLPDLPVRRVEVAVDGLGEGTPDPDAAVSLDDPIYVIYTSGSSGAPKGVVVPYRGILNRFLWMDDAFGTKASRSVLNTTNYVYDSAVWQLFWPLANGGKTVIPHPDAVMTADYFTETIVREGITVTDFVPSVFNVLVRQLEENEHFHRSLSTLQTIIIGGEEITPSAVRTFMSIFPHVQCMNLYGPTEASIGCIAYSITGAESGRIPIGKPISNVSIFILDQAGQPVPAGVPGEIHISGVCLADGYLNLPDRTAEAFLPNPFAPEGCGSGRMYKTGDLAKWRTDGNIEFLGRADFQVKIRGFRIELQEIERQMLACPGVREAVVIALEDEAAGKYLCAYMVADEEVETADVKRRISGILPQYMVPAHFVRLAAMPIAASGKTDRKALPKPDRGSLPEREYTAPRNETERVIAQVWAVALRQSQVGIHDNFFELGGDSIKALQVSSRLKAQGMSYTMPELFAYPTVAELAAIVKTVEAPSAEQGTVTGEVPLTPVQLRFLAREEEHLPYSQAVMLYRADGFRRELFARALDQLTAHHDALRMAYHREDGRLVQYNRGIGEPAYTLREFALQSESSPEERIAALALEVQESLTLTAGGPLTAAALFHTARGGHALLAIHHMAVDGVSWRILLEDFGRLYEGLLAGGEPVVLPAKTDSLREWALGLREYAADRSLLAQRAYWRGVEEAAVPPLPKDRQTSPGLLQDGGSVEAALSTAQTERLLRGVHHAYGTEINDILLSALELALREWSGTGAPQRIDLEGHGREAFASGLDVSRTVGWFTSVYPVVLRGGEAGDLSLTLRENKEMLRRIPGKGMGYGVLKHLTAAGENGEDPVLPQGPASEISFNYLGELTAEGVLPAGLALSPLPPGGGVSPRSRAVYALDINARVSGGVFAAKFDYSRRQYDRETVERLAGLFLDKLSLLIAYCAGVQAAVKTPSDYGDPTLKLAELEELERAVRDQGEIAKIYPLSPMQEGLLFHSVMDAGSESYFEQNLLTLEGGLELDLFRQSLQHLIARHDIFRTLFIHEGLASPRQVVLKARPAELAFADISGLVEAERAAYLADYKQKDRQRGFDLSRDMLLRAAVLRTGPQSHEIIWSEHHILLDGFSIGIVLKEFFAVYEALRKGETPLLGETVPYSRYIDWLKGRDLEEAERYWAGMLSGYDTPVTLHPRSGAGAAGYRQETVTAAADSALTARLEKLARSRSVTLNTVLQGAWSVLLRNYNDADDVVFGAVVSGRPPELDGVESMVGLFINTLPVRVRLPGDMPFDRLLAEIGRSGLEAETYSYCPLSAITRRSEAGAGLFDHIFVLENHPLGDELAALREKGAGGLAVAAADAFEQTHYDFNAIVIPGEELVFKLVYNANAYDNAYVEMLAGHLLALLRSIAANPEAPVGELEMLTEQDKRRLLHDFAGQAAGFPADRTLVGLFEEQAALRSGETALTDGNRSLTYGELNRQADAVAARLAEWGVGADRIVGILLEPSAEMIVSILGVLKAGGAYMPLDPDYPRERLDFMLEDSGAAALIADSRTRGRASFNGKLLSLDEDDWQGEGSASSRRPCVRPSDLAYIIYTSGTTGRPKGVMIEHRNVVRLLFNDRNLFDFTHRDVWTVFHSFCFDFSVWEMYGALLYGGRLVIVPRAVSRDPAAFADMLAKERVTVLNQTPTAFQNLVREESNAALPRLSLRYVIFGGEALKPSLLKAWKKRYPHTRLVNMYGITETTVHVTFKEIGEAEMARGASNIGRPIPTLTAYVLNKAQRPVPIGVPGELYVGGEGVARGYLNRPELTDERFVTLSLWGAAGETRERLYRSGDLVRFLPGGDMEYLGRIDHQVKIRGHRIEMGEIEAVLLSHPAIAEATVLAQKADGGNSELAAYYLSGEALPLLELRAFLAERLPQYMIPAYLVRIESMPLTSNGKINRAALPDPRQALRPAGEDIQPASEREKLLAQIWRDVLGVSSVGVTDNFFALGGDSIKALQIHSRLRQYGLKLEMKDMFAYPSVREQAARAASSTAVLSQEAVEGDVELTPVQRWFFAQGCAERLHYNQALMLYRREGFVPSALDEALRRLTVHHDALRMGYTFGEGGAVRQYNRRAAEQAHRLETADLREAEQAEAEIRRLADGLHAQMSLNDGGPLVRALLCQTSEGDHLLLAIHHLVVDGVSWRILLEDLTALYEGAAEGREVVLPGKTLSFQQWAARLKAFAESPRLDKEAAYWRALDAAGTLSLPKDHRADRGTFAATGSVAAELTEAETAALLYRASRAYRTEINDLLLTALGLALRDWSGQSRFLVDLEGHGRESWEEELDVSRTVGWFTAVYPVLLDMAQGEDISLALRTVKENLRRIPRKGLGYGALKYLSAPEGEGTGFAAQPEISFNYLGQMDTDVNGGLFSLSPYGIGQAASGDIPRTHSLDIGGKILGGRLQMGFDYSESQFARETVERLADLYSRHLRALIAHCEGVEAPVKTPSDYGDASLTFEELEAIAGSVQGAVAQIYPLTPMQEGMLYHALADRQPGAYFEQAALTLRGELDSALLERSMELLVQRHDIFRTAFVHRRLGRPRQAVLEQAALTLETADIAGLTAAEQERYIAELQRRDKETGFSPDSAPLMRMQLLRRGPRDYMLLWSFHHILLDGWCVGIIMKEFFETYGELRAGRQPCLPPAVPYRTFIQWLEEQDRGLAGAYWAAALAGYEPGAAVPYADPAGNGREFAAAELAFELAEDLSGRLAALAAASGVTVNTVFQAAWGVLLQKYNNTRDVVFGSVVSGRPAAVEGIEAMIGLFINTIPVRVRAERGASFASLLRAVQEAALQAEAYSHYPLYEIQSAHPAGDRLLNHLIAFENYPMNEHIRSLDLLEATGFEVLDVEMAEQINYAFGVVVLPGRRLGVKFTYNGNVYPEQAVRRIRGHFEDLLAALLDRPQDELASFSLVRAEEKAALAPRPAAAGNERPGHVLEMLRSQALRTPAHPAVIFGDAVLTYRGLWEQSDRLARRLIARGAKAETVIALMADRSPDTAVGLLGILKSGGVYLPLDPALPDERIAYMLDDSRAALLVAPTRLKEQAAAFGAPVLLMDGEEEAADPGSALAAAELDPHAGYPMTACGDCLPLPALDDLAYIIYTSGTTGRPKGVMVEHGGIGNSIAWRKEEYLLGTEDRVLQLFSASFDGFMTSFLTPLASGAVVVMLDEAEARDALAIRNAIVKYGITHFIAVPALYGAVLSLLSPADAASLRIVTLAGDKLTAGLIEETRRKNAGLELANEYGPTESSVVAACKRQAAPETAGSIGRAVRGVSVYILDAEGQPLPEGIPGEIVIGGAGVARGYWNRPELTAERFIPDPLSSAGGRAYRTGDLGRLLPEGELEFIGRLDHQLKVNGYRIEPGEIEAALLSHEAVEEAVVTAVSGAGGADILVAYYSAGKELDAAALRDYLGTRLPRYMLPGHFCAVDRLPYTAYGKIDRAALPDVRDMLSRRDHYAAPATDTQARLAAIWASLLGLERVGIRDHFFELGGNSLKLIQLQAEIEKHFQSGISVADLFAYTTIEQLARELDGSLEKERGPELEDRISRMLDSLESGGLELEAALESLLEMEED